MAEKEKRLAYRTEIQQMMFVSGETAEPSIDTIAIIENIVQQQVKEILNRCTIIANRQGQRAISVEHVLFIIRNDKAKINRVKNFLSWKDVRKNVKESNDDSKADEILPDDAAAGGGAVNPNEMAARGMNKHKKAQIKLPWDVHSYYAHWIPERDVVDEEQGGGDGEDSDDEMNATTLQRLKNADERTKGMTKEEYVHWSECRQASFTFRKGKRFREWAGFGIVTDSKPSDDVIDILGFLTYEIVEWLTETALKVKANEEANQRRSNAAAGAAGSSGGSGGGEEGEEDEAGAQSRKRKREMGMSLFAAQEKEKTPIQPRHIQEAFRISQRPTLKDTRFSSFKRPGWQPPLKLI